jgi:hypothetical protein
MNIIANYLCIKIPALVILIRQKRKKVAQHFSTQLTLPNCFMLCANQQSDEVDTTQCCTCVVVWKEITGNWHT